MVPGIRTAKVLWMEAGAMSGPPQHRHQIEFPNEIAEFFDEAARENEVIYMRLPGDDPVWRPLTYRGTDYGQWTDIWRLGLLTPRMGGPPYAERVIRIDKVRESRNMVYELRVADLGSKDAVDWQRRSRYTGSTGGPAGRNFGIW
jgi:hypothetical protein